MYTSEQARQAFNLLREAQDIKKELQKKRQHMGEQVYVKSLVSLDDTIACCARVIHKHLHVTSQDILRMCKQARDAFSSGLQRTAVPLVVLRNGSKILLPLRGKGRKENLDEH